VTDYRQVYPFTALVGQDHMRLALELNAVNPAIGGVLIRGEKGTAKSTAVRALARLLPELEVVRGCRFSCDPHSEHLCSECLQRVAGGESPLPGERRRMRVVELPINASEDRVVGSIDLEAAIRSGERRFEPGVLAEANRQILYVDEVNLLDDHIVDVLLDAAAMGVNVVEREGISIWHPSRFILVGTMNPEEGDLRPQLLDRFGLCVDVRGISDVKERVEIVLRREQFEADPEAFLASFSELEEAERLRIQGAIDGLESVAVSMNVLEAIARLAIALEVDGHRADLVARKAAQALSALQGLPQAGLTEVAAVAPMVMAHRVRNQPGQRVHDVAEVARRILGET
jgi:Mg-chelatase subunit ChlI